MATDDDDLGILVRLAASGELSPDEVAEVEQLIADRPELRAEFDRAMSGAHPSGRPEPSIAGSTDSLGEETEPAIEGVAYVAPSAPTRTPQRGPSGCLVGIGAFVLTVIVMATIGIVMRSRSDAPNISNSPVQAVLDDPSNEVLTLNGPPDLVDLGALALMYSPATGDAVLLGQDIGSAGELFGSDDPDTALASFRAGDVEELVADLNPDQTLTVVATASP